VASTAREIGLRYYRRQQRLTRLSANRVQALWRLLDATDLTASWHARVGPRIVKTVAAGQLASAALADGYVDSVVHAEGADSEREGEVRPEAFAGVAADGRSLESLMYLSVITSKERIGRGMAVDDALMFGLRQALRLSSSEVTQAGRAAVGSSMTGQRHHSGLRQGGAAAGLLPLRHPRRQGVRLEQGLPAAPQVRLRPPADHADRTPSAP
jgi:hypothetical protein